MQIYDPDDSWFDDPLLQALARSGRKRPPGSFVFDDTALGIEPQPPIAPRPPVTPERGTLDNPYTDAREPDWIPDDEQPERPEQDRPPEDIPIRRPELALQQPSPAEVRQGPLGGPPMLERPAFGPVSMALANAGGEFTPLRTSMGGRRPRRTRGIRQRTIARRYY